MKAAIVLLADYETQNYVRSIVFELDQLGGIEFFASHLPVHVSLKQPFAFESIEKLDAYFAALAAQTKPVQIDLTELYTSAWDDFGILGVNVKETTDLRRLHEQLNRELNALFADASALWDGDDYHFHMTIELGKVGKYNPFKAYYDAVEDRNVNRSFVARYLGLFYYTGENHLSFMNYKVLPLEG